MLYQFFITLDYQIIGKGLLALLVLYILVILHAKKYLHTFHTVIMVFLLVPLFLLINYIFIESTVGDNGWLFVQLALFAGIYFISSLAGALIDIPKDNSFNLSVLVLFTYYVFNLLYILSGWSDFSFGRGGFIILPIILLLLLFLGSAIISILATSSRFYFQVLVVMSIIFSGFMIDAKNNYDLKEQIEHEQWEAEKKAEKIEEIRVKKANSKVEQVFQNLWNYEGSYSILAKKLSLIKNETKEIEIEKGAIALMLFLEDENFKELFDKNRPKIIHEMNSVGTILFKHYEPKSEKAYLRLFSMLQTYPHDYGEPLYNFFHYHNKLFTFKKFVKKGYYEVALIALEHNNHIYSITIKEYFTYAKQISDEKIREKAMIFIINEIDIYGGRTIDNLPRILINIIDEKGIEKYMALLIKKASSYDYEYENMRGWSWHNNSKVKNEYIGMYRYLGAEHPLIKALYKDIKDFYLKNMKESSLVLDVNESHLLDTSWTNNRCDFESRFEQDGKVHYTFYKEDYYFSSENKIYVTQDWYKDKKCTINMSSSKHEFYVRYKEIALDDNVSGLYGIRIEELDTWENSFANLKQKDAYFSLKENKLCFSKSIFTNSIETTQFDRNGNAFTSSYSGFRINEKASDEVAYENCLIRK
jgi:hypothetical protein